MKLIKYILLLMVACNCFGGLEFIPANSTDCVVADFVAPTNAFTYSAWVKPSLVSANYTVILGKALNGASPHIRLYQSDSDGRLNLQSYIGGVSKNIKTDTAVLVNGEWIHIVGTYDGANLTLYINGEFNEALAATGTVEPKDGYDLHIGSLNNTSYRFSGELSDATIYSRALTSNEVASLYLEPPDPLTHSPNPSRGGAFYNHAVYTNQIALLPTPTKVQRFDTNGVDSLVFYSRLNSTDTATGNSCTNGHTFKSWDSNAHIITVNGTPIQKQP